jgi:hypothetical protein
MIRTSDDEDRCCAAAGEPPWEIKGWLFDQNIGFGPEVSELDVLPDVHLVSVHCLEFVSLHS